MGIFRFTFVIDGNNDNISPQNPEPMTHRWCYHAKKKITLPFKVATHKYLITVHCMIHTCIHLLRWTSQSIFFSHNLVYSALCALRFTQKKIKKNYERVASWAKPYNEKEFLFVPLSQRLLRQICYCGVRRNEMKKSKRKIILHNRLTYYFYCVAAKSDLIYFLFIFFLCFRFSYHFVRLLTLLMSILRRIYAISAINLYSSYHFTITITTTTTTTTTTNKFKWNQKKKEKENKNTKMSEKGDFTHTHKRAQQSIRLCVFFSSIYLSLFRPNRSLFLWIGLFTLLECAERENCTHWKCLHCVACLNAVMCCKYTGEREIVKKMSPPLHAAGFRSNGMILLF